MCVTTGAASTLRLFFVTAAEDGSFILSCAVQIRKESGIAGLYAGLSPTLVRAFPANAAAIVAWELAARMLYDDRKRD